MPPALTETQTLHPNSERNNITPPTLTEAQQKYKAFRRQRLIAARDMRDTPRPEFDDMPFLVYMDILKKADDQYVAPRKNAQDTSINLGTIRDKDTSLLEFGMSHDFEPVAQVYDEEDDMLDELAETGEDLVRKSLHLDDWKEKQKLIYRSMIAFGTALVEEQYVQRWEIAKTMKEGFRPGMGTSAAEWEQSMKLKYDGCVAKLWDLKKCYFGDITKFFMNGPQGQPYFFTVEYVTYDIAKQLFGSWDMWKYVPTTVVPTSEVSGATFSPWWTLRPVSLNVVEIIRYYDPVANEYSLTLNDVDMLPIMERKTMENGEEKTLISGYPLSEVSPSASIPFAKYDLEPMHEFAYSKSQPGKMRVSADVENMMVKLFIIMFKQKAKPTMGNKSGRNFGPEVTDPGTTINDIRDGDLFPVLPNYTGAVPADFSFFEIMKKELDKNSVERSWQGANPTQQDETATKTMNDQKQQSTLKVAAMFDGIISGNNQLFWLRTYNITKNWTKPIEKHVDELKKTVNDVYRTVSLPSEIEGGQKAVKKIQFTTSTPKLAPGEKSASIDDSFDVYQEELDHQEKGNGGEIRIAKLNPEVLRSMNLSWFYTCVPVPNGTDPLAYIVFAKQIQDAALMFGPESLNVKRLKHRFASRTGESFDTWFLNEKELALQQQQAAIAGGPGASGGAPKTGTPGVIPGKTPPGGPSIASTMASKGPANAMASMMK